MIKDSKVPQKTVLNHVLSALVFLYSVDAVTKICHFAQIALDSVNRSVAVELRVMHRQFSCEMMGSKPYKKSGLYDVTKK